MKSKKSSKITEPATFGNAMLSAAIPCPHEDIYLRKSGIWKCKKCGKVFY